MRKDSKFSVKWNFIFQVLARCIVLCLRLFLTYEIRVCPQLLLRFLPTLSNLYCQESGLFIRQFLCQAGQTHFNWVQLLQGQAQAILVWTHEWPRKWEADKGFRFLNQSFLRLHQLLCLLSQLTQPWPVMLCLIFIFLEVLSHITR